ncbi:anticodon-binding protein [Piptocephalis cylindrospora]|uniref:Anticodon-binding protein n=1 Tax=Piptocephalis cylindrospora TaxID=1907219 RepID=A0A4P9Y0E5_9FUNG|nr:anticodon-binding protein [Piptocephalis cylindrospora]|eukprot:RKP12124.1 anticodon-binding protein [Piptocephalis cylindrospora]
MASTPIVPSTIKNKIKREQVYNRQKKQKAALDKEMRMERRKQERADPELRKQRQTENIPSTLENTREADETVITEPDNEVAEDETTDEFASYYNGAAPKIVVTTSPHASRPTFEFAHELVTIFPNAEFVRRGAKFDIAQIVEFCKNRGYTDLIVINEDKKMPNALTICHLPEGPTAHFKLTSIRSGKDIRGHGRASAHKPELILNNLHTRLGHTVGRMFSALFPQVPEFQGRQACTLHNQRDFIFFRRHRYVFQNAKRVNLQEIGPRFTLKLRWLQKGTFNTQSGEYEWVFKPELETSRRRFFL